jgi:hypothetical protein
MSTNVFGVSALHIAKGNKHRGFVFNARTQAAVLSAAHLTVLVA